MNKVLVLLIALAAGLFSLVGVGPSQALADGPDGIGTSLKVDATALPKKPGQLVLTATLTGASGAKVNGREVAFYQTVDLLGARSSYLGSATTDATGTAAIIFSATETGTQTFVARFAGGNGLAKSESSAQLQVTQTTAVFEQQARPFGLVGQWLPYVLGALVLSVWVLLATLLLSTVSEIRSSARPRPLGTRRALSPMATRSGEAGGGS